MSIIDTILTNVKQLDINKMIENAMEKHKYEYVEEIRVQLLNGVDSKGRDIHPNYYEDSFFKTREASENYIKWKQKITPNSSRKPESPNLYINGYFHESLTLKVGQTASNVESTWSVGKNDIFKKYNKDVFAANQDFVLNKIIKEVREDVKNYKFR